MGTLISITGKVAYDPKCKEKLGTINFASFPLYVHYIHNVHKQAKPGTKAMVFLVDEMARAWHNKISMYDTIRVEGELVRKPYIEDGITKQSDIVYANYIEVL